MRPDDACRRMLRALIVYGPDSQDVRQVGENAFGRNLYKLLPEDEFDAQPLVAGGGRYLLVADIRIDNRADLTRKMGVEPADASRLSDASLLLLAWERWQLAATDYLLGDYAFATWDFDRSRLTLVRSPFSLKPLFYHVCPSFLAFASMPAGLHAIDAIKKNIDLAYATGTAAQLPYLGASTMFEGINTIPQGHAVQIQGGVVECTPIWSFGRARSTRFKSLPEVGEALRAELDRAVLAQIRRYRGRVAAHLSSGRDSSAVATTAALQLARQGEDLLAFTGAPRVRMETSADSLWLSDESGLAAQTAGLHPNVQHFVCRPQPGSAIRDIDLLQAVHHGPLSNVSNLPWWARINDEAAANGASVMLIGSCGNLTISAGGSSHLRDVMNEEGVMAWLRLAGQMGRLSPSRWRNLASVSFGPSMPASAYRFILKASGRWSDETWRTAILRQPYRQQAEALIREEWPDPRPPDSFFDRRRSLLERRDSPDKMSLARWGLDPRDPTADRDLVELCFSLPAKQLMSPSSARPVYEAAFEGRIPSSVLYSRQRGYQSADWFDHFGRNEMRNAFHAVGKNAIVRELLDLEYIDRTIEAWPTGGWDRREILQTYRSSLPCALALASFINLHFVK